MRPNLLLAAKLVAVCAVLTHQVGELPSHALPFVPFLGHVGSPEAFHRGLQVLFVVAAVSLFLNRFVRTACLVIGAVFVIGILSSEVYYHNNRLYVGVFFLLAALDGPRSDRSLLRYQLAVMYFGAAWNKLAEPDWHTGAFVQNWLPHYFHSYPHLSSILPDTVLSISLSWIGIVTEIALVVMLLVRRLLPLAVFVGVGYHTGLVVLTGGNTFGMFWYALAATYLALLTWPATAVLVHYAPAKTMHRGLKSFFQLCDLETRYRWLPESPGTLETEVGDTAYTGVGAGVRLLLYSPVVYVVFAVIASFRHVVIPLVLLLLAAVAFSEVFRRRPARSRPALRRSPAHSTDP